MTKRRGMGENEKKGKKKLKNEKKRKKLFVNETFYRRDEKRVRSLAPLQASNRLQRLQEITDKIAQIRFSSDFIVNFKICKIKINYLFRFSSYSKVFLLNINKYYQFLFLSISTLCFSFLSVKSFRLY